jgi:hypothetical protein
VRFHLDVVCVFWLGGQDRENGGMGEWGITIGLRINSTLARNQQFFFGMLSEKLIFGGIMKSPHHAI